MFTHTLRAFLLSTAVVAVIAPPLVAQLRPSEAGDVTIQDLVLPAPGEPLLASLALEGRERVVLLQPNNVRAPTFQLLVQGPGGALEQAMPPAERTYRGEIVGEPGSVVTARLLSNGLRAVVTSPELASAWEVRPVGRRVGALAPHIVRPVRDAAIGGYCSADIGGKGFDASSGAEYRGGGLRYCEIAIDCDVDYYVKHGSDVEATLAAVEDRINGINPLYESSVDVSFELVTVIVRTDAGSDPYADYDGNYTLLLDLFMDHWRTNHTSILRDTAHLFTDKYGGSTLGQAAWGICTCDSYAVSRAALSASALYNDMVVAHELGHVFGANHCDTSPNCWVMCSGIGGCSGPLMQFSQGVIAQILADPKPCLTESIATEPPVLDSISPLQIPALGVTPAQITGTGLGDTKSMRVVAPWGQIDDICSFEILDDETLEYDTPKPLALGTVQLAAIAIPGSSNALTFEYIATNPPLTVAPAVVFPPASVTWKVGAQPNLVGVLTLSLNNGTTTTVGSFTVLAQGAPVALGTLDAAGLAAHTRNLPEVLAPGTMYSQLTVYDGSTLVGASNVHVMLLKAPISGGG